MCARYLTFKEGRDDDLFFGITSSRYDPQQLKEIHPTDTAPVFVQEGNLITARAMKWGLPMQRAGVIFNARAETLEEKKLFRESFYFRRCAVPAWGFYEWDHESGRRYIFRDKNDTPVYMAGIYQPAADGFRFVVVTTQASTPVDEIHVRMPLILRPDQALKWLDSAETAHNLLKIHAASLIKEAAFA